MACIWPGTINCHLLLNQLLWNAFSISFPDENVLYNLKSFDYIQNLLAQYRVFHFYILVSFPKYPWYRYRLHDDDDSSLLCAYLTETNMNWSTRHPSCMFWHPWWKWAENLAVPYQEVFLLVLMCLKYLVPQMSGLAPAAWEIANYCSVPLIFWFN